MRRWVCLQWTRPACALWRTCLPSSWPPGRVGHSRMWQPQATVFFLLEVILHAANRLYKPSLHFKLTHGFGQPHLQVKQQRVQCADGDGGWRQAHRDGGAGGFGWRCWAAGRAACCVRMAEGLRIARGLILHPFCQGKQDREDDAGSESTTCACHLMHFTSDHHTPLHCTRPPWRRPW